MPNIKCFEKNYPELKPAYEKLVKEGVSEIEAATRVINDEGSSLTKQVNDLKSSINSKIKKSVFVPFENKNEIEKVKKEFDDKIADQNQKLDAIRNDEQRKQIKELIKKAENISSERLAEIISQKASIPLQEAKQLVNEVRGEKPRVRVVVGKEPNIPEETQKLTDSGGRKYSGIKKTLVSDELVRNINFTSITDSSMMNLGRKILETGEVKPRELVQKIISEGSGVLTPAQVVGLITYKADLDNNLEKLYDQYNSKKQKGQNTGTLEIEIKNAEQDIENYDVMAIITANQQSMAFRLRQKMLDRDYNIVTIIEKYKKLNNGEISKETEAKIRETHKKLEEVRNKLKEAEQKIEKLEEDRALLNIKESVAKELTDEQINIKIQEGVDKEINKIYETLPQDKKSMADKAIAALEKFRNKLKGRAYESTLGIPIAIADLGAVTAIRAIKLGKSIADAVDAGIKRIKKELKGVDWEQESEYRELLTKTLEDEGIKVKKGKEKPVILEDGTLKIPNELIRGLVKDGVSDINEITDKVYDMVIEDLPDITKREVRDYITEYGKRINPTADEIQQKINEAKRIGRLLSELEDLQNNIRKEKGARANLTQKEKELKVKIKALERELFGAEGKNDEQKLADAKVRVRGKIRELQTKLLNKDYSKPVKKISPNDAELAELKAEKERLQDELDNEIYKQELKNRSFWQKAEDIAIELFSGLIRGLVASFDLSAGLVQGLWRLFSNPVLSAKAFGDMFKSLVSERASDKLLANIKASKNYSIVKASKLALDDKAGKVSAKEGLFISNWVNAIWDFASKIISLNYKPVTNILKAINPYKASQRAFDGYVNSIRYNSFMQMVASLEKDGYSFEDNPDVFKKAADFVNTTTGRGSLGQADAQSRWLNLVFFAPRKVISEVKLYSPYAFVYYARMPKAVRKRAIINLATFLANFMTINTLLWAAKNGMDDEEDENDNFWNPNSSDFLTHKIGDKRVSIAGGAKSMIVFQSRLWSGEFTDQWGQTSKLGERYGKPINTRLDLAFRFVLGKAAPAVSVLAKKLDEKKGVDVDDAEIIKDLTVPIWMQDLREMYKDTPESVATILTVFSFFGANVRTIQQRQGVSIGDLPKEIQEDYKRTNDDSFIPPSVPKTIYQNKISYNLTQEQYEYFSSEVKKERLNVIKDKFSNNDFLEKYNSKSDIERIELLKKYYSTARDRAKSKLIQKYPEIKKYFYEENKFINEKIKEQRLERSINK